MGYCHDGWWLNQQFCCWEIEGEEDNACDSWHPWSTVTIARWFIYVIFAVSSFFSFSLPTLYLKHRQVIFSFTAAHLVKSMAKYAAGSGISEIKCILAGFVMQSFLGFATFFIKSITLASRQDSVVNEGTNITIALGHCFWPFGRERRSFSPCRLLCRLISSRDVWEVLPKPRLVSKDACNIQDITTFS
jgi:hypothetical protein